MQGFTRRGDRAGFTLVELVVVIGIIAMLIGLLLPSLSKARQQALSVACTSNMRQVGLHLLMYANENRGVMFPFDWGYGTVIDGRPIEREERWPVYVFDPPVWNPPILLCPADLEPREEHSYMLNGHLARRDVRYSGQNVLNMSPSEIILMGEKVSSEPDYYMWGGNEIYKIEEFRHGTAGSNYLFLDMHVKTVLRERAAPGIDQWEVTTIDQEDEEDPE